MLKVNHLINVREQNFCCKKEPNLIDRNIIGINFFMLGIKVNSLKVSVHHIKTKVNHIHIHMYVQMYRKHTTKQYNRENNVKWRLNYN